MELNNYAIRGNQANRIKSIQAINAVEKCMKKYGVPKPPTGQRSRLHHDLPSTPEKKEAEVLRRFKYLNLLPKSVDEIAQKLNDLLVYAETGKSLKSDLIAIAVMKKLETFEDEINNAENALIGTQKDQSSRLGYAHGLRKDMLNRLENIKKRDLKVAEYLKQYEEKGFIRRFSVPASLYPDIFANSAQPIKRPKHQLKSSLWRNINLYAVNIDEKVREDIDKFREIGTIKKQLFSMPQYFRDREQRGVKLPANVLKATSKDVEIKVQDFDTQIARLVAMEHVERKKIENLKQKLNPVRFKSPLI